MSRERGEMRMYNLVDEHGTGILMPWVRYGIKTNDFSLLKEFFESMVKYFMYNDGNGKYIPISELVMIRNKQRNAILSALRRKKGHGKSGPNILEDFDQSTQSKGDFSKALKLLDGFVNSNRNIKYRLVVWDLNEKGNMGENLLNLCLLHNTAEHNMLAKKLVQHFPKMINDIFVSEEYYGLSPLHQAIVNEDIQMLYFLLKNKADVHQRCYGSFFCADDQKDTRSDSLEHEWVDVQPNTRYTGRMYWGEYPLSFAACTRQPDCIRLLCAFKADPNVRDTNGNTVLHMCVIHSLPDMFQLVHSLGAKLQITNEQQLTPLGLAAKLAKKDASIFPCYSTEILNYLQMFDVIINIEKLTLWSCRDTVCTAYPLRGIDTIDEITGQLNQSSVLSLVVYGDKSDHLDFLDNLLDDLLQKKWEAFGMRKLIHSIIGYTIYLIAFFIAFLIRTPRAPYEPFYYSNGTYSSQNSTMHFFTNGYFGLNEHLYQDERCYLWSYSDTPGSYLQRIRLICELIAVISSLIQFGHEAREIIHSSHKRWWLTTKTFPGKIIHKTSFLIILLMVPIRFACSLSEWAVVVENVLGIVAALTTSMHCLFFFRAVKFIGPFILMVYKIIVDDIIRFLLIYSVFLLCFSQAFFIIFKSCERDSGPDFENVFSSPGEGLLRMFIMSVGEFTAIYKNLQSCQSVIGIQGKIVFLIYELLVTVMLLNLLIAMMTRTYERIAETQKEWKRQWAQVILMLERSVPPGERLRIMIEYSRPLKVDKTQRALVVRQKKDKTTPISVKKRNHQKKKPLHRLLTLNSLNLNMLRRASGFSESDNSAMEMSRSIA